MRLPAWLCPLAFAALLALDGRANADPSGYRLDGRRVTLRQLVLAAQAVGARLSYPQVRPQRHAYHTGPSVALPRLKRRGPGRPRTRVTAMKGGAP
jgi:hypothetical protein